METVRALRDAVFAPLWLDTLSLPEPTPPLTQNTSCDLLIVGGGFTGLWAAILAKEADPVRDVLLIESGRIAHGASGRPGGIVSTSIMHGLQNAQRLFPGDIDALEHLGRQNMEGFLASLARYDVDAEAEWGGEMTVAIGPEAWPAIVAEHALHLDHGHRADLLDRAAVQAEIAAPLFDGACWNRERSGTVHPARLAFGLLRANRSLGVRVHEGTRLRSIERTGRALSVATEHHKISARRVLLCTNAFASGDRRIQRRVAGIRDRIIATEPLSRDQMDRIGWRNRQGVYDTRTQLNYMRLTRDDRIVFGGRLAYFFNGHNAPDPALERTASPYLRLAEAFYRTFPQLEDVRFSHAWSGPIALTTRMAVHFQTYHGGDVVWAGGYSGFGVSTSRFGARIGLAKLYRADLPELQMAFARTMPGRIPPEPLRWLGAQITLHAIDTADELGGWRRPWLRMVERMGFPLS